MDTFHPFWTLFQKHSFQPFSTLKVKYISSRCRGVTSIEAEEAVASSLFKGLCIITIVNDAAASSL